MSGLSIPTLRADVDVFKRNPDTGAQVLVSTTRPCYECGQPLVGLVVQVPGSDFQAHATCRRTHGSIS
jgi:hypothetical protein